MSFPRQYARTQRLTLGEPRDVVVSPDGQRVVFTRSRAGDDQVNCLWCLDLSRDDPGPRLIADPKELLAADDRADLPPEERARRERAREGAGGIVAYATDSEVRVAAFALGGRLFVAGLLSASARALDVPGPVFDPRPDPTARRVAYVSGRTLRIAELDGSSRSIAADENEQVSWGSAEFIAAEEMGRQRGYWWSPDGEQLAIARVDITPVRRWYLADPTEPGAEPRAIAYPAAGTDNATVHLAVVGLDGSNRYVSWDTTQFPYLTDVVWAAGTPLTIQVQSRDQRTTRVLVVDPVTGETSVAAEEADEAWVELVPGTPAWSGRRLVTAIEREGARRLAFDGTPVTPAELQLRGVLSVDDAAVWFTANALDEPTEQHVWRADASGSVARLTEAKGIHTGAAGGGTVVVRSTSLDHAGVRTVVRPLAGGDSIELESLAETPLVSPQVTIKWAGPGPLATALLLPTGHSGDAKLPVLLDIYGGPHAQRVVRSRNAYLTSQWLADQGFAVLVIDGRGTPGRGSEWERAVQHDLAGPILDDQVAGLQAVAAGRPELDLTRVAIRGWSFGGYLAAMAVLRRPDVFHAAVAGAPVTDWRLYDTHYTERYLGRPDEQPDAYTRTSLIPDAPSLTRPLLLIHGLNDDNVVAAHTLQLSRALLEAGRFHTVLPLPGVSHMTPQEEVAENLLLVQVAFLRQALGLG